MLLNEFKCSLVRVVNQFPLATTKTMFAIRYGDQLMFYSVAAELPGH